MFAHLDERRATSVLRTHFCATLIKFQLCFYVLGGSAFYAVTIELRYISCRSSNSETKLSI